LITLVLLLIRYVRHELALRRLARVAGDS